MSDEYKNVLSITELAEYTKYICEHDTEFITETSQITFDEVMMHCRKCAAYSEVPKNWYLADVGVVT